MAAQWTATSAFFVGAQALAMSWVNFAPSRTKSVLDMEIIDDLGEMERRKGEWEELFRASSHRSLHGEPDFCLNWMRTFGHLKSSSPDRASSEKSQARPATPLLILIRNRGRLDIAMPLRLVPTRAKYMTPNPFPDFMSILPTQSLQGLINSHSQFTNISIREGSEAFAVKAIPEALSALSWQSINLGLTPRNSVLARTLDSALASISSKTPSTESADNKLVFDGAYQELLEREPSLRKNIERARRRLERDFGPISLRWWKGQDALSIGFPAFVEVDSESWKANKVGGEALDDAPNAKRYYHDLTERLSRNGSAHAWGLYLGDEIAAAQLCYESRGVLHGYKTSYKEKFAPKADCRPGFVLLSLVIEHAWNEFAALSAMGGIIDRQFQPSVEPFERSLYAAKHPWRRLVTF